MFDETMPKTPQLANILMAYEEYRESLLRLYNRLDIGSCYAGDPNPLVAGLLVAQVLGGVALPLSGGVLGNVEVFGPDGERVRVYVASDCDGMFQVFSVTMKSDDYDVLAMVAFVHARPVAVHLIPRDRLAAVCEVFGQTGGPFGPMLPIAVLTHAHFVVEPVIAAAMGVQTILLHESPRALNADGTVAG